MLGKLTEPVSQSDWTELLGRVEYALNNTVHDTTKQTACILLFGVNQRGPQVDELSEYLAVKLNQALAVDLPQIREQASEAIAVSQRKNELLYAKRSVPPAH